MAETFKHLAQGILLNSGDSPSTANQLLYEAPSGTTTIVGHIRLSNTSGASKTAKLWQNGVANTNVVLPALTIEGGGWAEFTGSIIMDAGDILYGVSASDATSVTYNLYGLEVT